jgi:phosphate transport system permease protein
MTDFATSAMNKTDLARPAGTSFLGRRYAAERRFKAYGALALALTIAFLIYLIADIVSKGAPAFYESHAKLQITIDPAKVDPANIAGSDFQGLIKEAFRARFPDVTSRSDKKKLTSLLSAGAAEDLAAQVIHDPALIGKTISASILLSDDADQYLKGWTQGETNPWLEDLKAKGEVESLFSYRFLASGDSREAELAGLWGALIGSLMTAAVAIGLSLPLGVAAAIYLEEFAPKNRWTVFIEVNINNLAAVPSIIFGLLGLAIFLNVFGLPRSAPYVGGLVLSLLVLPTIIIAARAAVKAVPPSIKEAALGVGASHQQAVLHHVLPLALPGIMTGAILGLARAFGETAPLLMIGMVAFVADIPQTFSDAATVLPVQIFLWSDLPEAAFQSKTAAAIMVLMVVLFALNAMAIYLRRRFERRW